MTTEARGVFWDHQLIEDVFSRALWHPAGGYEYEHHQILDPMWKLPHADGAIFVFPARHNVGHVHELNQALAQYRWCIVIGTGDEEGIFPWHEISHSRRKVWGMCFPGAKGVDRPLGSGYSPNFPRLLDPVRLRAPGRLDVFFCGQDTHARRHEALDAAREIPSNLRLIRATSEFGAYDEGAPGGLSRVEYAQGMADAKVCPCPSGPETPDSFRLYEALEAGSIPVADGSTPKGHVEGYWPYVFGEHVPFPVIDNWRELPEQVARIKSEWPALGSRVSAWWQLWKRKLAYALDADVQELSGMDPERLTPDDLISVIIPTCPINSHPSTAMIEEVVESVRAQLPLAEIIIVFDGVRPGMEHKTQDYEEHIQRVTRLCAGWHNVVPLILDEWGHQANGTRAALELVTTPLILFVEHDTPVVGEIDWQGLCYVVESGIVNMVRLHHQTAIHPDHRHMMIDETESLHGVTDEHPGVPLLRTLQWSQRPHLATTKFYRERVMPYFGKESRTYIEWIMHGAVQHGVEKGREQTWDKWRVAIYYPPGGNIERSTHLDGRAGASLEEAVWAYDGPAPPGAPPPSRG